MDLGRESLRQKHPDLEDLAEEINPFKSEDFIDLVTIIEDDDLLKFGQFDEKTLLEKYYENIETVKRASPKLSDDTPSVALRSKGEPGVQRKASKAQTLQQENNVKRAAGEL